jgi:hypothetical protein
MATNKDQIGEQVIVEFILRICMAYLHMQINPNKQLFSLELKERKFSCGLYHITLFAYTNISILIVPINYRDHRFGGLHTKLIAHCNPHSSRMR